MNLRAMFLQIRDSRIETLLSATADGYVGTLSCAGGCRGEPNTPGAAGHDNVLVL